VIDWKCSVVYGTAPNLVIAFAWTIVLTAVARENFFSPRVARHLGGARYGDPLFVFFAVELDVYL
jgi:hypothetical protein